MSVTRRQIREHELDAVMRKLETYGDEYQREAFQELRDENDKLRTALTRIAEEMNAVYLTGERPSRGRCIQLASEIRKLLEDT